MILGMTVNEVLILIGMVIVFSGFAMYARSGRRGNHFDDYHNH